MEKLLKSILIMSILPLSACNLSGEQKEGDLVTWEVTPQLIIKTELGLQRELIANVSGSSFYTYKKYVGLFPFDYKPIEYQHLSAENASDIIKTKNARYKAYTLTFDLALNDAKFKPNDYIIRSSSVMVHEDQIRVEVKKNINKHLKVITDDEIRTGKYNEELSLNTNLECYFFDKTIQAGNRDIAHKYTWCIGKPDNKSIPEVAIEILNFDDDQVIANYNSEKLGINVSWRVDKKHLKDWENIHTHTWNLINSWNVSPNT